MYNVRHQPKAEDDTEVEIIDNLSLYQALMLARNRALTYQRPQDIYYDDNYHLTIGQGL